MVDQVEHPDRVVITSMARLGLRVLRVRDCMNAPPDGLGTRRHRIGSPGAGRRTLSPDRLPTMVRSSSKAGALMTASTAPTGGASRRVPPARR